MRLPRAIVNHHAATIPIAVIILLCLRRASCFTAPVPLLYLAVSPLLMEKEEKVMAKRFED